MSLGLPRVHHRRTDSTNERARELAEAGAPHWTLVTADEQTAGRGRQGRAWSAPPGTSVLMSLLVREPDPLLPLAAAVAVCEACEAVAAVECAIKWPNDVWIEGRKVAGILVEGRPREGWAVLGIGLNAAVAEFPAELSDNAISLPSVPVDDALTALLEALSRRLADSPERILGAWRERDALRGSRVHWESNEGTAVGVSDSGALVVETSDGRVELDAGEVHLG
jgi:BirA family biotin operon repressor/biotin-[acetyl-CoA-carboxylase] ligase